MEIDSFIQRADYLEKEIVILERKIKRYPKGRLACVHNGKYKKWYVRYDGEGHYITKKRNKYLHTMAEKLYMEALLADEKIEHKLLMDAEIEFYYERPISLAGNWFVPDFTCINRTNKKIYYYEHFGMVDNDEYNKNMYKKLKTYNDNGIYQDINLICTYETSETPLDMRDVQNQIKRFLL